MITVQRERIGGQRNQIHSGPFGNFCERAYLGSYSNSITFTAKNQQNSITLKTPLEIFYSTTFKMPAPNCTITLTSSDGVNITVDRKAAELSIGIRDFLKNLPGECVEAIPIRKCLAFPIEINEPLLRKVLEWCTYHRDDPPPKQDDTTEIGEWDQNFMHVRYMDYDSIHIFDAALVLDIKCLEKLCVEVFRNRMTPEEEEQIRQEGRYWGAVWSSMIIDD